MSKLIHLKAFAFVFLIAQVMLPSRIEAVMSGRLQTYELPLFLSLSFALAFFVSVLVQMQNNGFSLIGTKKHKAMDSLKVDNGDNVPRTVRE